MFASLRVKGWILAAAAALALGCAAGVLIRSAFAVRPVSAAPSQGSRFPPSCIMAFCGIPRFRGLM